MKRPRRELKVDGAVELPHVLSYLEQLVKALNSGTVRVHRGDENVVLGPRGVIGFSLAVSEKGKRQKLALELTWRRYEAPDADLDLVIAPAVELPPAAEPVAEVASPVAATETVPPVPPTAETVPPEPPTAEAVPPEPPMPGEVVLGEPD